MYLYLPRHCFLRTLQQNEAFCRVQFLRNVWPYWNCLVKIASNLHVLLLFHVKIIMVFTRHTTVICLRKTECAVVTLNMISGWWSNGVPKSNVCQKLFNSKNKNNFDSFTSFISHYTTCFKIILSKLSCICAFSPLHQPLFFSRCKIYANVTSVIK